MTTKKEQEVTDEGARSFAVFLHGIGEGAFHAVLSEELRETEAPDNDADAAPRVVWTNQGKCVVPPLRAGLGAEVRRIPGRSRSGGAEWELQ
jgi:hypothetical protein